MQMQIYDKTAVPPLVATLSMLFQTNPQTKVLIANAVRNIDTFSTFLEACGESIGHGSRKRTDLLTVE